MRRAPTENIWPLECVGNTSRNMVIDVAQFCFLLQMPLIMFAAISVSMLIDRVFPDFLPWGIGIAIILVILSYVHLRLTIGSVAAKHPGECWPELMQTHQFRGLEGNSLRRAALLEVDEEIDEEFEEIEGLP